MRGFAVYPRLFWVLLLIFVGLGWIYEGFAVFAMLAGGIMLPWLRHLYLNPLAGVKQPYYHWLKTVPFTPDKTLPNGSLMPGFQDAMVLALVCSLAGKYDAPLVHQVALAGWSVAIMATIFTLITARQLLNTGPCWIGYVCLCTLILWASLPFLIAYIELVNFKAWPIAVLLMPPTVAFAAAVVGLKLMMKRYPWDGTGLKYGAILDNRMLTELTYGHSDFREISEPFMSLSPNATWPRLRSVHVYGLSALVGAVYLTLLSYVPPFDATLFALVGAGMIWSRYMTYYSNLIPTLPRVPRAEHFTDQKWRRSFAFSLVILLVMTAAGYVVLRYVPGIPGMILGTAGAMLITVAAFRLPPSRRTWETVGFRQIDLFPKLGEAAQGIERRKSFKLGR